MASDSSSQKQNITVWYIFVAAMGILLLQTWLATYSQVEAIPFSQFEQLVAQGEVTEVAVGPDTIHGTVKNKLPSGKTQFVTTRVDSALADKLEAKGIVVTGVPSGGLIPTLLSWIVPAVVFYLIWMYLVRHVADRQGFGGLMTIGKSNAKVYVEKDTKVTFADVAGVEEAKFELQEVVSFLKDPKELRKARRPRSQRHSAGGTARHGKDAAGARRRRRGRRSVLLHLRFRVRRDVRGCRGRARARSVRSGAEGRAQYHFHRRARCVGTQPEQRWPRWKR